MYGVRAFSNPWSGMGHEGMLRVYLFAKLHRDENVASIFFRKERDTVDPLKAAEKICGSSHTQKSHQKCLIRKADGARMFRRN